MSELTFTKSFLTTLDAKPQKYASDYVFPPGSFASRNPYTLPKLPHPPYPLPPQPTTTVAPAPGSTASQLLTVTLKSSRNPPLNVTIEKVDASETTITQLKEAVKKDLEANGSTVDLSKVKVLYNKKPVAPSKNTLADVLSGETISANKTIELGIMIIGGVTPFTPEAASTATDDAMEGVTETTTKSAAQGPSGKELLEKEEFWDDLQGFLEQRLKDQAEAVRLRGLFKAALG